MISAKFEPPASLKAFFPVRWRQACLALALFVGGSLPLSAAPLLGSRGNSSIKLSTQPAGATIYIDGQSSGKTPGEVEGLGPGRYFVRVELEGYRPAEMIVEVSSGQNLQFAPIQLVSEGAPRPAEPAPVAATPAPRPVARPATTPVPATPAPAPATPAPAPLPMRNAPAPIFPDDKPVEPPAPSPAPVAPPVSTPAAASGQEIIQPLVAAHLRAIVDGDIDGYVKMCAPKVDMYDEGSQGRESIRKSRQRLKDRWPVYEISDVRDFTVKAGDRPEVQRASVTYDWKVSNPKTGKKASGSATDTLDFRQTDGQWLIVKMRQTVARGAKSKN